MKDLTLKILLQREIKVCFKVLGLWSSRASCVKSDFTSMFTTSHIVVHEFHLKAAPDQTVVGQVALWII